MKRHVAAIMVLITALLVVDSHVDWVNQDGGKLLEVNGQRFDLRGWAAEQARAWQSDCNAWTPLTTLSHNSPTAQAILLTLQQHSLPDSRSARLLQLLQQDDWSVAEVAFDTLNPSLVVLRLQGEQWRVQDRAVWSGSTAPWHSGDLVRRYLRENAPGLPKALIDCVKVDPKRYGPGPGGLGPVSALGNRP
jgi:hypothetical protein